MHYCYYVSCVCVRVCDVRHYCYGADAMRERESRLLNPPPGSTDPNAKLLAACKTLASQPPKDERSISALVGFKRLASVSQAVIYRQEPRREAAARLLDQ